MRSTKRVMALLLIMAMVLMTAAGCGKKNDIGLDKDTDKSVASNLANSFEEADNVSYVLVYNPDVYNQFSDMNMDLGTGDFDQDIVDVTAVRAGELPAPSEFNVVPKGQDDASGKFDFEGYDPSANRASPLVAPYSVGDTHDFYCNIGDSDVWTGETFVCRYAGEHCCIWTMDGASDVTDEQAATCGEKFDTEIYERDVEIFGEPRYADNGGKIHILTYDLGSDLNYLTLGFFCLSDIAYTSADLTEEEREQYQINVDHAILHLNSFVFQYEELEESSYSTMAHEFQHLIFGSSVMCEPDPHHFQTCLNEAMSGYAEEALYPGSKEGHIYSVEDSSRVRHGQSLYNFGTESGDIGVYGNVFLFSEFLKELGGETVMHGIHDYVRTTSDAIPTDSGSLYEALGPDVVSTINESIVFPEGFTFAGEVQEFMSKLTLAY